MGLALEVGILADLLENDEEGYEYFNGIESFSCVCLMRGCMKSIEAGAVLVFC